MKLQAILRKDGTTIYVLYLPIKAVKDAGLLKGDNLEVSTTEIGSLVLKRI